jgi:hypothetical protein
MKKLISKKHLPSYFDNLAQKKTDAKTASVEIFPVKRFY